MTAKLLAALVFAIGAVESGNNPNAPDNGKSVGMYQMKMSFVRQVNRLTGKKYKSSHRRNPSYARWILEDWLQTKFPDATKKDVYEIALTFRCGRVGRLNATEEQKDYARRVCNLVEQKMKEGK